MKTQKFIQVSLIFVAILLMGFSSSNLSLKNNSASFNVEIFEEAEEELELEAWMSDEHIWNYSNKLEKMQLLEVEAEEDLKIEVWMFNNELWQL